MRKTVLVAAVAALCGLSTGSASAATVIGSDLLAAPTEGCVVDLYECTLTQTSGTSLVAPTDGVVTQYRLRHGAVQSGIATVELRILGGAGPDFSARRVEPQNDILKSTAPATETFRFTDASNWYTGAPIAAGERLALYSSDGPVPLVAAGSGAGETAGSHGSGTAAYTSRDGQLLLQATIEPDVDHDGYGDETQDGCVGITGNCGGGSAGGTLTPFRAGSITEFHARTISVYRAPTISVYHSSVNLYAAILQGFSAPVNCSVACQVVAYASMRAISGALYGFASRGVVVARSSGRLPTGGDGRLSIPLTPQAKRALKKARRSQVVTFHLTVRDWKGAVTTRTINVTLKPRRR